MFFSPKIRKNDLFGHFLPQKPPNSYSKNYFSPLQKPLILVVLPPIACRKPPKTPTFEPFSTKTPLFDQKRPFLTKKPPFLALFDPLGPPSDPQIPQIPILNPHFLTPKTLNFTPKMG